MKTVAIFSHEDRLNAHRYKVRLTAFSLLHHGHVLVLTLRSSAPLPHMTLCSVLLPFGDFPPFITRPIMPQLKIPAETPGQWKLLDDTDWL